MSTTDPTTLSPEEVAAVKASWEKCIPIADQAAELFYGRLFELDPSLRSMFKSDMKEQGKKLMQTITVAVRALDRLDTIVADVRALGARHRNYGVRPEHYATVAEALLWTLGKGLGDVFDEDLKSAWTKTYTILATAMQEEAGPTPATTS